MLWPFRLLLAKARPLTGAAITRITISPTVIALFLAVDLLLFLLSLPVTLGALVIVVLVRFFPVRRVNQIVATIAILVLTLAVIAFRMSRPERFFAPISTDDVARVLRTSEHPSMDRYPGTALG